MQKQIWLTDENNNRCSIKYFGSHEAAQVALDSLQDCHDCVNCKNCVKCANCIGCENCNNCFYSQYCLNCNDIASCRSCSELQEKQMYYYNQMFAVPTIANIHKVLYETINSHGKLNMSSWHTCQTTHCRAGWVVHLAGDAGYALEAQTNVEFAAMAIYKASGYDIELDKFYVENNKAMADIKQLAGVE